MASCDPRFRINSADHRSIIWNYSNKRASGVRFAFSGGDTAAMSMPLAATETVPGISPSIIVKPLSAALGAEILGVDLRQELPAETIADIIDAWHEHLVIVFRDQTLSEDEQIRFARHFGVL